MIFSEKEYDLFSKPVPPLSPGERFWIMRLRPRRATATRIDNQAGNKCPNVTTEY
jgi:hypothetical protein